MSNRARKSYFEWWMDRLKEMQGDKEQAKKLYSATSQANPADSWSILKLAVLANYVDIYTTIIKNFSEKAYYLETNAGCGLNSIADVDNTLVFGSPMIASTKPRKKFDEYILIEKSTVYCEALKHLIPEALVINGDANSDVKYNNNHRGLRYALDKVQSNIPILAFVDPYGMDIRWETLVLLLDRWSDVIINFQNVSRTVGSAAHNPKYIDTLTNFFGTRDWQNCRTQEDYLDIYTTQIKRYKDYAIPIRIQGPWNYHYYLIVAVKKTRGTQGWIDAVFRTKEKVEKASYKDAIKFIDVFRKKQATLF